MCSYLSRIAAVREYLDVYGISSYTKWSGRLDVAAAVKVVTAVHRMEQDNFSNVKSVGAGVYEFRIDFGPGCRIQYSHWESRGNHA